MQCHSVCYVIIPIVLSNFSAFGFASGVTSKMGGTWNVGIYHRTCNGSGSKKEEICLHPTNLTLLMANHPTNATPYWKVSPLLIAKMNYSEPWFLRHIVYSDLNFNSASVRRELGGGLLYDTWSFWTNHRSEHLLMLFHLGPDTELIYIISAFALHTFVFCDSMVLQKVLFWCGRVGLHTSQFGV